MSKITRSTLKSFIWKEYKKNNLYVMQKSSFDGMTDGVEKINGARFRRVTEELDISLSHHFNIEGLWLVGGSRDYFTKYEDKEYEGIEICNSCGTSIIAKKNKHMMKQEELKSFSDQSLEEMRKDLTNVIEQFPNRNNEYTQHMLNTVCEEIATRQADREFIEQEQAANDIVS